jgi:uncharacterized protein YhbP (UPF0306 family)
MDVEKVIREYLPQIIHMSLATCEGDTPWVCEVHYSYDHDLNIYWRSVLSRRHSQEIAKNSKVAGNIVVQHQPGENVQGVYFEGNASLLDNVDENHQAYLTYSRRFGAGPKILEEAKTPDGHRFFMIKVNNFYVFDARVSNPGQKYQLKWG